jgi:glycosyltransferase involved in cell wall biosynthesis
VPGVSVVVPTFNRASLLGGALDSIQSQSMGDWECIVVDDGSTDGTPDLVASRAVADRRIRLLRIEHAGSPGRSRNIGIRASCGDLVAFLDDDDLWLPGKLASQVVLLAAEREPVMVCARVERFGDAVGPWPRSLPKSPDLRSLLASNSIACSTVVVRRSALDQSGLFDESLRRAQDLDLWIRLLAVGPICGQDAILARYRVDSARRALQLPIEHEALEHVFARLRGSVPDRYFRPARKRIHRFRARAAGGLRERLTEWWRMLIA